MEAGREDVSARALKVSLRVDPDIPVWVVGDPHRLGQVIDALLSNAVKFTDEGEVLLSAELKTLSAKDAHVRICVTDTGVGIPEDRLEAVFDPLTQADDSHTRRHDGAGLGLTIAHRLVEGMGGDLRADSEVGVGSTFTIEISWPLPSAI